MNGKGTANTVMIKARVTDIFTQDFVRVGCDLINAYFVIDEYNDVAEPEIAAQVCDTVMDVLRNPYKERKSGDKLGIFMQGYALVS